MSSSHDTYDDAKMEKDPERTSKVDVVESQPSELDEHYIDPEAEKRLLRKLDLNIAPVMCMIFFLSYLDRSTIGLAASAGLSKDANLVGTQLNTAIVCFYATYVVFEAPASIAMKKFRPSVMVSLFLTLWGIVTVGCGWVNSFESLLTCRLLLGALESGIFPMLALYLASFYKPQDSGRRVAYLFVASALSGAFGGLIAYGVFRMDGLAGKRGWQFLYIIEGAITVVWGIAVFFLLADTPDKARYLTPEEKELMAIRSRQSSIYNGTQTFEWRQVRAAATDYKLYHSAIAQLCANVASFGFSTFLPTIIRGFKFSVLTTQLICVPIYLWAAAVYITVAYFSDRVNARTPFLVPLALCTVVGYALLLAPITLIGVKIFALLLCATGIYCIVGLNVTMLTSSHAPYYKRSAAIGFQQSIGNCGGFIASYIYLSKDAPRYQLGAAVTMACVSIACILYALQGWNFRRLNRIRDNLSPDERQRWIDEGKEGDAHPDFRFPF